MSRAHPPNFERWIRLQHRPCLLLTRHARTTLIPAGHSYPARIPGNHDPSQTRLFQTTPSHNAARAPSTRRKQDIEAGRLSRPSTPGPRRVSRESSEHDSLETQTHFLEKFGHIFAREMLQDGVIDSSVTQRQIQQVAGSLMEAAVGYVPSKNAILDIAQDHNVSVDDVFEIGLTFTMKNRKFYRWLFESSTHAGVRTAIYLDALYYIRAYERNLDEQGLRTDIELARAKEPPLIYALGQVKSFATLPEGKSGAKVQNRDPRALLIWAEYLGSRGKWKQSTSLIRDALQFIEPVRKPVKGSENLKMFGLLDLPWISLLKMLRKRRKNEQDLVDTSRDGSEIKTMPVDEIEAMRLGAVEYQDPVMLLPYAQYLGQKEGIQAYERHMWQAATSGDTDACRKLANFYYLTSMGRFPQTETDAAKQFKLYEMKKASSGPLTAGSQQPTKLMAFFARVLSYFGPRPVDEYRSMAVEWYMIALEGGCLKSGVNLIQVLQEAGESQKAEEFQKDVMQRLENAGETAKDYVGLAKRLLGGGPGQTNSQMEEYLDL